MRSHRRRCGSIDENEDRRWKMARRFAPSSILHLPSSFLYLNPSPPAIGAVGHPTGDGDADRAGDDGGGERRHRAVAQVALADGGGGIDQRGLGWHGVLTRAAQRREFPAPDIDIVQLWVMQFLMGGLEGIDD